VIYRREIDGLRAVAVVPVVLFHAGYEAFSGGYVGVDVFFVISGYLITSLILQEQEAGDFTFLKFYERRARRILPALFVILGVTSILAVLLFLPDDLREFGQSLVSVTTFLSNIYFLRESGYFETAAELKPLLHTWSLAIEEQYYLVFPPLLLLALKLSRRVAVVIFALTASISLALAQWGPVFKEGANFFLLTARAWELLVGALLAMWHNQTGIDQRAASVKSEVVGLVGLSAILLAVFEFDDSFLFPGLWALVPTLGAAMVIAYATQATMVGRLLGTRSLVWIGLISYSAYLWHQPLLAMARYRSLTPLSNITVAMLVLAVFPLAFFTWRYVEAPYRDRRRVDRTKVYKMAATGSIAFAVVGFVFHFTGGLEATPYFRHDSRQLAILEDTSVAAVDDGDCRFSSDKFDKATVARFDECSVRYGRALLIVGDSHARDMHNALVANSKRAFIFTLSNIIFWPHSYVDDRVSADIANFVSTHRNRIERLFYAQAGFYLVAGQVGEAGRRSLFQRSSVPLYPLFELGIGRVTTMLSRLSEDVPVTWLGPWVEPHLNIVEVRRRAVACELPAGSLLQKNVAANFLRLDADLKRASAAAGVDYISVADAIAFDSSKDLYSCDAVYWSDGDHWSSAGELRFGAKLMANIADQYDL
jgi:peptidoglycan/LPS O-acetylase OafA/YrhL